MLDMMGIELGEVGVMKTCWECPSSDLTAQGACVE